MLIKLKRYYYLSVVLLISFLISSCVEEPNIDPVKTPFAVVRIGNFAPSVANMNITITDQNKSFTLPYKSITSYFDIKPGNRKFLITSGTDTLWNKEIEFSSYQTMSLFFYGQFSKVDTLMNFQNIRVDEGEVYKDFSPSSGKFNITFLHLITDDISVYPAKKQAILNIKEVKVIDTTKVDTTWLFQSFELKSFGSKLNVVSGVHQYHYSLDNTSNPVFYFKDSTTFNPNKKYYIILSGKGQNFVSTKVESDPLPVRSK